MAQRMGITTPINTHPSMVLGTSDVRLLDMTRAFASISQKGAAVIPYGIVRVATPKGQLLYQHEPKEPRVLVTPWVAAYMTDLLQAAVLTGTGRAANIGRPVAGKTGTTSSNKDGWFIGFSSGLTTGVWMGRDDAKPLPGLQGGTSPARAFQSFMTKAVASRPAENFDTSVPAPDWQVDAEEDPWAGSSDEFLTNPDGSAVRGPDGQPLRAAPREISPEERETIEGAPPSERLDQDWLDDAIGRTRAPPPPRDSPPPARRQPSTVPPPQGTQQRPPGFD
jgi:penicillin-binding protein 1A